MLKELIAARVDLYVDQGDSYYKVITVKDNNGTVIDLTALTLLSTVRKYSNTKTVYPLTVTTEEPNLGKLIISLNPAESMQYNSSRYVYEIRLSDGTDTTKIMVGQILVEHGAASAYTSLAINGNQSVGE